MVIFSLLLSAVGLVRLDLDEAIGTKSDPPALALGHC